MQRPWPNNHIYTIKIGTPYLKISVIMIVWGAYLWGVGVGGGGGLSGEFTVI